MTVRKLTQWTFKPSTHHCNLPFWSHTHGSHWTHEDPIYSNNLYHFIIVDDFMCYKWVLFLPCKSDAFEAFINSMHLSPHYKGTLRVAQSDCGENFYWRNSSSTWRSRDAPPTHGATYATTNGVTERANWTMAEAAWAMLQSAGMSQGFGNVKSPQLYTYETVHHHV